MSSESSTEPSTIPTVQDFTEDDLNPSYGPTSTRPVGVNLSPIQRHRIFESFLDAMHNGDSVRKALRKANVSWRTVGRWMSTNESWSAQYAQAQKHGAAIWADRAVSEAWKPAETMTAVVRNRLRSEVARWRASVQNPAWSEKQGDTTVNLNLSLNSVHLSMLRHREPVHSGLVEVEQVPQLPSSDPNSSDTSRG